MRRWRRGFKRRQPGLGLSGDDFDGFIAAASAEIEAMGRFIESYLSGRGTLPRLRQTWCNAVFWFHEGMSEPLDTVAMVKLEVAIENLFLAESTAKAKWRMLEGLRGMFGISESDAISPSSDMTFRKVVNDIAKTRSSVLHGTSPTLPGRDLGVDRGLVEGMARQFLIGYPQLVEAYERELGAAEDDTEALLKWSMTRGGGGPELRDMRGLGERNAEGIAARGGAGRVEGVSSARPLGKDATDRSGAISVSGVDNLMEGDVSPQPVQSTLAGATQAATSIEDCGDRAAVLARIVPVLYRAGEVSEVSNCLSLALADARKIPEGAMRASALGCIAGAQAETGDREGARMTVEEAGAAIGAEVGGGDGCSALDAIAKAQAVIGEFSEAIATAGRLEDRFLRDRVLGEVAGLAAKAAAFGDALSAVRAMVGCDERTRCLASIARAQGRFGDVSGADRSIVEAVEAAGEIEDETERVLALVDLCSVEVEIEDDAGAARSIANALSLARTIEDEGDRVFALAHIARNQPRLGAASLAPRTIAEAIALVPRIGEGGERASALCWIAEAQARIGDRDAALRSIAQALESAAIAADVFNSDGIPGQIALAQASAGDNRAALATAQRIQGESGNDGLLGDICEVQCWEGHVGEAVATARQISSARARCEALVNVARVQARDGDAEGAARAMALALEAGGAIADSSERGLALAGIGELQLDAVAEFVTG